MPTRSGGADDGSVRIVAGIAAGWGVVLLAWAAYNCFAQVGIGTFVEGIFYYGVSDGAARAETNSLNYAVVYLASAWLMFSGRGWARGIVAGVALVEGYNRLRSLTGALFDAPQRVWFTGTVEGWLKLVTFAAGLVVTAVLVLVVLRSLAAAGADEPAGSGSWAPGPFQPTFGQPAFGQPQQPWPGAQPQPTFGQPAFGQPQPHAQPQPAFAQPQQPWPGAQHPAAPVQPTPPVQPQQPVQAQSQQPVQAQPVQSQPAGPQAAAAPPAGEAGQGDR